VCAVRTHLDQDLNGLALTFVTTVVTVTAVPGLAAIRAVTRFRRSNLNAQDLSSHADHLATLQ